MRRMNPNHTVQIWPREPPDEHGAAVNNALRGCESTYRSQTLSTGAQSESAGVRDGLDQQSGGAVACAGPCPVW